MSHQHHSLYEPKKIIPVLASLDDIESVLENDQAGTGTRPVDR